MRLHVLMLLLGSTVCGFVLLPGPPSAAAEGVAAIAVASGGSHACALTTEGGVKCWGSDGGGQLGIDGDLQNHSAPVDVEGLQSGVASVVLGRRHTCALTEAGGVKCWGWNSRGQLGMTGVVCSSPDGPSLPCSAVPVDVPGLKSGVAAISAGTFHTCVLTEEGGVKCWGDNSVGQLGDGTTISRVEPADVAGLTAGVQGIAAGSQHTCAITSAGGVKCWGNNNVSELGAESSDTCVSLFGDLHPCNTTPLDVETLDGGVAALSANGPFTCALTLDAGVKCWGQNGNAELGDGTFGNIRRTPMDVCANALCEAPLTGVAAVAAGGLHTCALMISGGLKCWGANFFGQIGDGDLNIDDRTTPVDVCRVYDTGGQRCVEAVSGAAAVAPGFFHTCALMEDGGVKCWGENATGVLGIGAFDGDRNPLPLDVVGFGLKPPPTETATITPPTTPTPSPTTTPTPPSPTGDADCSGGVTSIDAALVLQFDAALLDTLPCEEAADADGDGTVTSLDAALILQLTSGLLVV